MKNQVLDKPTKQATSYSSTKEAASLRQNNPSRNSSKISLSFIFALLSIPTAFVLLWSYALGALASTVQLFFWPLTVIGVLLLMILASNFSK